MTLGLLLASCAVAGLSAISSEAEAKVPDQPLAIRHDSISRPAPIPQVHRVKKSTAKRRAPAISAVRKKHRRIVDLIGSSLKMCGGPAEPSYAELMDDPLDDDATIDELEIESISFDTYLFDDQKKRTPTLLVLVTRAFHEKLVYASDVAEPVVVWTDRVDEAVERVRILPRLPSPSDDGSASA